MKIVATEDIAALQQRLRHDERLSTLRKVTHTIAHDLGTPINVVAGRAGIIASRPGVDDTVKKNANVIVEQTRAMTKILDEVLAFAERETREPEQCRVSELVDLAVALSEPLAQAAGVRIAREGDADLHTRLDPLKVLQVLTNLLVNAVQASRDGSTVRIHFGHRRVTTPPDLRCEAGDYLFLRIEDEGRGMSAECVDGLWLPFYTQRPGIRGPSLGLTVVHGIVREHGGFIEIDSEEGRGTSVAVHLPMERMH